MNVIIDPRTGRQWAAEVEREVSYWWLVVWEPGGQHLTAFYRGHWGKGGVYCKGRDPQELWPRLRTIQDEAHRRATTGTPVPPLLVEQLPAALWRAAG